MRPGARPQRIVWWLGGLAVVAAAGVGSDASLERLFDADGLRHAGDVLGALAAPDLSGDVVARVLRLLAESVAIGLAGIALAVLLGVPLAVGAAIVPGLTAPTGRGQLPGRLFGGAARWAARSVLVVLRGVPEIVWAYLFVRVFGLGPGPAVVAIGLHFAGVMGKLYAEQIEAVDPRPVHALAAAGASRSIVLISAVWPQVWRHWIGYGLFRLECAVRSASVLGVVGAGGIGAEIALSVQQFEFERLATALLGVLAVLVLLEAGSAWLRGRRARWTLAAVAAGAVVGAASLGVPWGDLMSAHAGEQLAAYVGAFAEPAFGGGFAAQAAGWVLETLAMACFGTGVAAAVAWLLAPIAARRMGREVAGAPSEGAATRIMGVVVRGLLQLARAIPDLVWALIFVVWVGPGAFAGALAVAAHSTGVLGRLFAETLEDTASDASDALARAGGGRLVRWRYAAGPLAAPRQLAFALFRFEVNLRATVMVGFVGAGGLGDAIHTAISLFHQRELAALLLVLLATVMVVDTGGGWLRRRLLARV